MKNIIKKWLGITVLEETVAMLAIDALKGIIGELDSELNQGKKKSTKKKK